MVDGFYGHPFPLPAGFPSGFLREMTELSGLDIYPSLV